MIHLTALSTRALILFTLMGSFFHIQAQTKLEGYFNSSYNSFYPTNKQYGVVEIELNHLGRISLCDKIGVANQEGQILVEPVYYNICFILKNPNWIIADSLQKTFLISIKEPAKKRLLSRRNFYSSMAEERYYSIQQNDSLHYLFDIVREINVYGPDSNLIENEEPFGFRLYKNNSSAFFDTNLVQKTPYFLTYMEYRSHDSMIELESGNIVIGRDGTRYISGHKAFGLMDTLGNVVIEPKYDKISSIWPGNQYFQATSNGFHQIETTGVDGGDQLIYNRNGKLVSDKKCKEVHRFVPEHDVFIITTDGDYEFLDDSKSPIRASTPILYIKHPSKNLLKTNGEVVLKKGVDDIDYVGGSYFLFEEDHHFYLYNFKTKKKKLLNQYERYEDPELGYIRVHKNKQTGLLDSNEHLLGGKLADNYLQIRDGFVVFELKGKKCLYNSKGNLVIPPLYDEMEIQTAYWHKSSNDYMIKIGKGIGDQIKYGLTDIKGHIIIQPLYEDVNICEHPYMRYIVKQHGKFAYFNPKGKPCSDFIFDQLENQNYNRMSFENIYQGHNVLLDSTGNLQRINGYYVQYMLNKSYKKLFRQEGMNIADENNQLQFEHDIETENSLNIRQLRLGKSQGKWGMYNERGYVIIPFKYDTLLQTNNQSLSYSINGESGQMNFDGTKKTAN